VNLTKNLAGMVLTGGASKRMGLDKTTILIAGEPCASRVARALRAVASPCIEVGPGKTSLPHILEPEPGGGPAAAITAGWFALRRLGHVGPVLVVAGDLPLITEAFLDWLANQPEDGSVVPEVDGRRQPLLARWSTADMDAVAKATIAGRRSLGDLPNSPGTRTVTEAAWCMAAAPETCSDIDTPDDLRRLGLLTEYQSTIHQLRRIGHSASGAERGMTADHDDS
jgi:molybdenum cofactor guanylyltransferase